MTLTESSNICYISARVAYTIKLNIKGTFLGNMGFPVSVYTLNGLLSQIKRPMTRRIYYLVREGQIPATLSSLWETLGLMLSKVGIKKFGNPS